jgi:hypothetical protein
MLRSRLPPEVRYGTAYLVPDFVTDCEPQILPALLLGLLTAPHCDFYHFLNLHASRLIIT